MKQGLVIKAIAGFFYVYSTGQVYECKGTSKLKRDKQKILPGDEVMFDVENLYIKEVLPRDNELIRPMLANVRGAILVFSVVEPNMNFGLLDRMLMIMGKNGLSPIILMTKADLSEKDILNTVEEKLGYYDNIGYKVLWNNHIDTPEKLKKYLSFNKYVLTGQSGVGKSTFLNKMIKDANAKTSEISHVLGRGKHTTRETTFYDLDRETYLIDTPGFSSFDIELSKEEIRDNFPDFVKLSSECRFGGCYHLKEPGCNVKDKLSEGIILKSRYENYVKFMEEK